MNYRPLFLAASLAMPVSCYALNPIVQTIYTADPAPLVHQDTVYVYTGHDEDGSTWFTMKDWRCYSSQDMVNWTDHGSPLSLKDFSWAKSDAWAGQCIERGGKFFFYVPVNQTNGGMAIGVAVADKPTGPFKDALGKPLVFDKWGDIDPCVFLDDDGQAYLAWGNPTYKYVRLNPDMISYDTSIGDQGIVRHPMTVEAFGLRTGDTNRATLYEEGPWLSKRNGLYYLVFAGGPIPEHIAYSTGPSATGPWTYRGVIIPTQGTSFTDHAGHIDFKGHSYMFYHNGALPGGGGFTRSVCVEEFKYNADGTFPTINMTKDGPAPVGHLNPYQRTEAETIAWASGVETTNSREAGVYVTDTHDGDYIQVRNVDFGGKGAAKFLARVAGGNTYGAIELRLDSVTGELIGTLKMKSTGAGDKWKTQSCQVSGAKGVHDLFLKFTGGSGLLLNFDWWKFE